LIKPDIVYKSSNKSNNIESVDLLGLEGESSKSFQNFESFNNPGFDVQGNKIRPKSSQMQNMKECNTFLNQCSCS